MIKKREVKVELEFPVAVDGADGKQAMRNQLTICRPKTMHAKRLACIIGADFAKELLGGSAKNADDVSDIDAKELFATLSSKLFIDDTLDELTSIIASMCNESTEFIDELDVADLLKVMQAFLSFFPVLQSIMQSSSAQTQPLASIGDQAT